MKILAENKNALSFEQRTSIINDALASLFWTSPILNPDIGKREPPAKYKRESLIAYADGTNWNPGNGAGLYYYDGAVWRFLYNTSQALNADTVDTKHASDLLARANHTGIQAPSTISPQGPGSGLNADSVDGEHLEVKEDSSITNLAAGGQSEITLTFTLLSNKNLVMNVKGSVNSNIAWKSHSRTTTYYEIQSGGKGTAPSDPATPDVQHTARVRVRNNHSAAQHIYIVGVAVG